MVKPYSRRQLTREEKIANYRISRGWRVVENAFGILVSQFRVLLGTMEQRPRVVKDIVFIFVVFHNTLRPHQGEADRAPTRGIMAQQNEEMVYVPNTLQESFEGGQTSMRTTEGLLQSHRSIDWAGEQNLRCVNQRPWGSWHVSILFRLIISNFQG